MTREHAARFVAFAFLAAAAAGCGGGGDDGGVPGFTETRGFDFTVTVAGTTSTLQDVAFFRDEGLTQPGVTLASSQNPSLATPGASVTGQQAVAPVGSGFSLAIHFDASGSIDDNGRDPGGLRFDAADIAVAEVGQRAPSTDTRIYTFRSTYPNGFKLVFGPFDASDGSARTSGIGAARTEGANANSPALTATFNIIGDGSGSPAGTLPAGQPHAMLLLTDGENNAEDANIAPHRPCTGGEGGVTGCSDDIDNVVSRATARNTTIFVAGLGNVDTELEKFRRLAQQTGGAFVKVTRAEELGTQFRNIGALMANGGVVVSGRTDPVEVVTGGNPFVKGWMRFRQASGGCPGTSVAHGSDFCKIPF